MRRPLLLAAVAAASAATAVPATAYEAPKPTCATYITHFGMDNPPPSSCTSGGAPQLNGLVTLRRFHVQVTAGEVNASLTCRNPWWSSSDSAVFGESTGVQTLEVVEDAGMACVAQLATSTLGTVASGVTSFTYVYPYGA